jgi:hypothetical protein
MEPINAVYDGLPNHTVRANAHGTDPGTVVLAIGGPLGGALELTASDARRLMLQLSCAHVHALSLCEVANAQSSVYAHA